MQTMTTNQFHTAHLDAYPLTQADKAFIAVQKGFDALDARIRRLQSFRKADDDRHLAPTLAALRWQLETASAALRGIAPLAVELAEVGPIDMDALGERFGMV